MGPGQRDRGSDRLPLPRSPSEAPSVLGSGRGGRFTFRRPLALCQGDGVNNAHDYDAIWRGSGTTLWRAVYAYAGGRRDVADDAVAEAFARVMARGAEVREPLPYLYRVAFRVASAELARSGKEAAEMPARSPRRIPRRTACPTCSACSRS